MNRPPASEGRAPDDRLPHCPFCGSVDVERLSRFGSQLLTEQSYCRACRTPFEAVRRADDEVAAGPRAGRHDRGDDRGGGRGGDR